MKKENHNCHAEERSILKSEFFVMNNNTLNRRKFISQSSLAMGSLLLPASCYSFRQSRKLGVVLVGLGRYSTGQLGPALKQTKYCSLAGVVTGSKEKGE